MLFYKKNEAENPNIFTVIEASTCAKVPDI